MPRDIRHDEKKIAELLGDFLRSRRARFAGFVRGPRQTLGYARTVLRRREPRHLGHNPLGGWMVLALFAWIGALALTGWLYTTDRYWADETVEWLHELLAWSLIGLVANGTKIGHDALRFR